MRSTLRRSIPTRLPHLGSHDDAQDAAYEIFLKILHSVGEFEERGVPLRAWVFRVAHNHLLDRQTRERRTFPHEPAALVGLLDGLNDDGCPSVGDAGHARDEEFFRFTRALPARQRQVLILRYVLDLDIPATAAALGISEGAARNVQHRALETLRARHTPAQVAGARNPQRLKMRRRRAAAPVLVARQRALPAR